MSLLERLDSDLKAAMKSGDEIKISVIRMLRSSITYAKAAKNAKKVFTDEDIVGFIQTGLKQRKESIEQYEKGKRTDLAEREKEEKKILESYLPAQLSEEEIKKLVEQVLAETGAVSAKDMGKVMAKLMPLTRGKADNSIVSSIVKTKLR
jgi:hypothetical protein